MYIFYVAVFFCIIIEVTISISCKRFTENERMNEGFSYENQIIFGDIYLKHLLPKVSILELP
jgi:hypothetical protein